LQEGKQEQKRNASRTYQEGKMIILILGMTLLAACAAAGYIGNTPDGQEACNGTANTRQ